ncbi:Endoglucanase A precursor [Minicystis rosea]|nr:Endoglucanase A precursor [Minicystis rosea]
MGFTALASLFGAACIPSQAADAPATDAPVPAQSQAQAPSKPAGPTSPSAPPAAPEPPTKQTGNVNTDRFLALWTDIHKMSNGYFSPEGIPYHSIETLIVEAPDHGHETTSEAYSYWIWLEAAYGRATKDWSFLDRAWSSLEYYMIPRPSEQPTNASYSAAKPATYAEEGDLPNQYPKPLDSSVAIGTDPIATELKAAYGTPDIYGMHWLMDVDNWYGFGRSGDPSARAVLINTFQRGPQESCWEAVTQPTWEDFKWGGSHGYLDIFQKAGSYAKQWKYSAAPDADARAVQAAYWAKVWADEQGGNASVDAVTKKAAKLGDYTRYSFFDKYFKTMGCTSPSCPTSKGYGSAHYLISWFYAWGGSAPPGGGWAWRIASSHNHSGYQNPMAAYALAKSPALKPVSPNGARDWDTSLTRQIEFYRWLQSSEGAIAGGATNSWKGRYEAPPKGTKTFYGMAYDEAPVFVDPPSNEWFGFQVWSVERVAEYYYASGDPNAKLVLDKWVAWAKANTKLLKDGGYEIPSTLQWSGQPSLDWNEKTRTFTNDKSFNAGLHVKVLNSTDDVGTTAAYAQTLTFYAAKAKDKEAQKLAKELLDRMWAKHRTEKGLTNPEVRKDYKRFNEPLYVPPGFTGKMPNGDVIDAKSTFFSIRSKYKDDPSWGKVKAYLDGGQPPSFVYHRFWAQAHCALAYATYGWLFP